MWAVDEARVLRRWAADAGQVDAWVRRRVAGEPLEHIVGRVEFGDMDLHVGPGVFVPRRRSLLLAEVAVEQVGARGGVFVEACCGVAPIGAVVRERKPRTPVLLADVQERALDFARRNVPRADICHGDLLAALPRANRQIAVIAAVPPYVPDVEARLLPSEAGDHEPRRALFGGSDGLDTVRLLLAEAVDHLSRDGVVIVELHRDQTGPAGEFATSLGYGASVVAGDDGQTRVLVARVGDHGPDQASRR